MVERRHESTESISKALNGREFQTWFYRVSHGELLVRSPKGGEHPTNVDIMFTGVDYLDLPRMLGEVKIVQPSEDDVRRAQARCPNVISADKVFVLSAKANRYIVVAAFMRVGENDGDIFDVPFQ